MLLTATYLSVCLWLRLKLWWHNMKYLSLIKNNIQRSSLVFRKLGHISTLPNQQVGKDSLKEYTATEWKEKLILLEGKHEMLSVTPQIHIDLHEWTSYLAKQDFDSRSAAKNCDTCHLILRAQHPANAEEFLQYSFSGKSSGKIKVLDYVVPLAWHAGQPFSIAAESSVEGLAHLAMAFMESSPIVLDDMLELTEMTSVVLDGHAANLLQADDVRRLHLQSEASSSPDCSTPCSILSSVGDASGDWCSSNESVTPTSNITNAESMFSALDVSYGSDIAQTSTPNVVKFMSMKGSGSNSIESAFDTLYASADSSQPSQDISWDEQSMENEHVAEEPKLEAEETSTCMTPKIGLVESSPDCRQSEGKPPNVLVYCGQKDSTRQFDAVKEIVSQCLNTNRYVIYHLRHGDVHTVPWSDNTRLLVISSECVYGGVDAAFLKYFWQGGAIISFTSAFDTLFVEHVQSRSIPGVLRMSFEQCSEVSVICGCYTYDGTSSQLPGVDVRVVATDAKTRKPVILQVLDDNSGGVAFLSQVNLDKHPAEMAISPEIYTALKETTPERLQILTRMFSALGMDVSQGEPLSTTPCILFGVSQNQKDQLLKSAVPRLQDGVLRSRKISLHFVDDARLLTTTSSPGKAIPLLTSPSSHVACAFDVVEYGSWLNTKVLGQVVMYTDVAETTMTLIDCIIPCTPEGVGVIAVAGRQTKGHGRGGNQWLSPSGCAMFSLHVRVPLQSELGRRLAYLQHIAALAVLEGVRTLSGCQDIDLRVKWPNDIYFGKTVKLGGVIVNSSITGDKIDANIGCGVNVTNSDPTTCINDLLAQYNSGHDTVLQPLTIEQLIGLSVSKMEELIELFQTHGKEAFLELYYSRWLHSNQTIHLHSEDGPTATVVGLDEHGYLSVKMASDGDVISVQPDGNSFDMMRNLISPKR